MKEYDNTNTAIVFVEDGLFNKEGVEALGKKPVIVVKVNIDGVEKQISLWFSKDKETGKYRLTKNGNKMLTGKVEAPYQEGAFTDKSATPKPQFEKSQVVSDDIPF